MNLLIGSTCISLSCGLFSSESLFVKPSSSEWEGMRCAHLKYPVMAQPERGDVFHSILIPPFGLLSTILSAEQVNILEREKFYIRPIVLKKKL